MIVLQVFALIMMRWTPDHLKDHTSLRGMKEQNLTSDATQKALALARSVNFQEVSKT